jgi:hypothetical protein
MSGLVVPTVPSTHGDEVHMIFMGIDKRTRGTGKPCYHQVQVVTRHLPSHCTWVVPILHCVRAEDVEVPTHNMLDHTSDVATTALEIVNLTSNHSVVPSRVQDKAAPGAYKMTISQSLIKAYDHVPDVAVGTARIFEKRLDGTTNQYMVMKSLSFSECPTIPATWGVVCNTFKDKLLPIHILSPQYMNDERDDILLYDDLPVVDKDGKKHAAAPHNQHHSTFKNLQVIISAPGLTVNDISIDADKVGLFNEKNRLPQGVVKVSTLKSRGGVDDGSKLLALKTHLETMYPDLDFDVTNLIGIHIEGAFFNGDWFLDGEKLKFKSVNEQASIYEKKCVENKVQPIITNGKKKRKAAKKKDVSVTFADSTVARNTLYTLPEEVAKVSINEDTEPFLIERVLYEDMLRLACSLYQGTFKGKPSPDGVNVATTVSTFKRLTRIRQDFLDIESNRIKEATEANAKRSEAIRAKKISDESEALKQQQILKETARSVEESSVVFNPFVALALYLRQQAKDSESINLFSQWGSSIEKTATLKFQDIFKGSPTQFASFKRAANDIEMYNKDHRRTTRLDDGNTCLAKEFDSLFYEANETWFPNVLSLVKAAIAQKDAKKEE